MKKKEQNQLTHSNLIMEALPKKKLLLNFTNVQLDQVSMQLYQSLVDEALIEIYLDDNINNCITMYKDKKRDFIKTNLGIINDYVVALTKYIQCKNFLSS